MKQQLIDTFNISKDNQSNLYKCDLPTQKLENLERLLKLVLNKSVLSYISRPSLMVEFNNNLELKRIKCMCSNLAINEVKFFGYEYLNIDKGIIDIKEYNVTDNIYNFMKSKGDIYLSELREAIIDINNNIKEIIEDVKHLLLFL